MCDYRHLKTWGLRFLSKELMHSCLFSLLQTKKNLCLLHWEPTAFTFSFVFSLGQELLVLATWVCHSGSYPKTFDLSQNLIPILINKSLVEFELCPVIVPYCPIFSCAPWHGFSWWWLTIFHHIQAQCRGNNFSHKRGKRPSCF